MERLLSAPSLFPHLPEAAFSINSSDAGPQREREEERGEGVGGFLPFTVPSRVASKSLLLEPSSFQMSNEQSGWEGKFQGHCLRQNGPPEASLSSGEIDRKGWGKGRYTERQRCSPANIRQDRQGRTSCVTKIESELAGGLGPLCLSLPLPLLWCLSCFTNWTDQYHHSFSQHHPMPHAHHTRMA